MEKSLPLVKNWHGQLGTGEPLIYQIPQKLPNLKAKDVATNSFGSYFVDLNGSLWSVGYGDANDLGNGSTGHTTSGERLWMANVSSCRFPWQPCLIH